MSELQRHEMREEIYMNMDIDGSGFISYHEMKVFMTRKYIEIHKGN